MVKIILIGVVTLSALGVALFGLFYLPLPDKTARQTIGEEKSVALIENAGHALLPEQPEAVSNAVLDYLQSFPKPDK